MTPEELVDSIESRGLDVVPAFRSMELSDQAVTAEMVMRKLRTTDHIDHRRLLALFAYDAELFGLEQVLVYLLQDPRTKGNRSTLLWILGHLEWEHHLDLVVRLAICDEQDTRWTALDILEHVDNLDVDALTVQRWRVAAAKALKKHPTERAVQDVCEWLETFEGIDQITRLELLVGDE